MNNQSINQAQLICHLSKSAFKRVLRNTFELTDWSGMLGKVNSSHERCNAFVPLLEKEKSCRVSQANCSNRKINGHSGEDVEGA